MAWYFLSNALTKLYDARRGRQQPALAPFASTGEVVARVWSEVGAAHGFEELEAKDERLLGWSGTRGGVECGFELRAVARSIVPHTLVAARLPAGSAPRLRVRPANSWRRALRGLGVGRAIGDADFDRAFVARGPDVALLDPALRELLEAHHARGAVFEVGFGVVELVLEGALLDRDELGRALATVVRIAGAARP